MLPAMLRVRKCKVDRFLHDREAPARRTASVAPYAASLEYYHSMTGGTQNDRSDNKLYAKFHLLLKMFSFFCV
jgi:hypothetical protein